MKSRRRPPTGPSVAQNNGQELTLPLLQQSLSPLPSSLSGSPTSQWGSNLEFGDRPGNFIPQTKSQSTSQVTVNKEEATSSLPTASTSEDDARTVYSAATTVMPNLTRQSISDVCENIQARIGPPAASYTDSGYASAPTTGTKVDSLRTHGDQAVAQFTREPVEQDVDDTATEYSNVSSTTFSRQKHYIRELADDLFSKIGSLNADEKTQTGFSEILPELLKAFALKVGHDAPTQLHRDVMAFVHRHRR